MSTRQDTSERIGPPLNDVSSDRLACLLRHWTWADEALAALDRDLADALVGEDDPAADRPFGSYYHWCALLCGFSEAALDGGLLSASELDALQHDIESTLPRLRACRQLLVVIPESFETHHLVADLFDDAETLGRLRRIHDAFGEAVRQERTLRQIESLDH